MDQSPHEQWRRMVGVGYGTVFSIFKSEARRVFPTLISQFPAGACKKRKLILIWSIVSHIGASAAPASPKSGARMAPGMCPIDCPKCAAARPTFPNASGRHQLVSRALGASAD